MRIYEKLLKLKRGVRIQISITFRCNFNCPNCCQKFATGKRPVCNESSLHDWEDFFLNKFPYKIKEVYVSGGEPTLMPYFPELVNWLLTQGYFVKIYTNIKRLNVLLKMKRSRRLKIVTTYYKGHDLNKFLNSYNILKRKYEMIVEEMGSKTLTFSKLKREETRNDNNNLAKVCIRIDPAIKLHLNCDELFRENQ